MAVPRALFQVILRMDFDTTRERRRIPVERTLQFAQEQTVLLI